MAKAAASSPGAPVSVDDFWSNLTDDELRKVVWTTSDPMKLENIQPEVPEDLPDFTIELEYQLDRATDAPVRCAHCPHHQSHWHGFVLLAADGRRFLLGSLCGPKAYKSDYFVASKARNRAKKRAEALISWDTMRDRLQDILTAFTETTRDPSFAIVRRIRGAWAGQAPGVRDAIARIGRDHLSGQQEMRFSRARRDRHAEGLRDLRFFQEAEKLAHLPTKQHRIAIAELKNRLGSGEIWRTEEGDLGRLEGPEWLTGAEDPFKLMDGAAARLRAYYALGAKTADKATPQIEQLTREAKNELACIAEQIRRIKTAGEFFQPEHLSRLSTWAASTFAEHTRRMIVYQDGKLTVSDGYHPSVTFEWPGGWQPPGRDLLELIT